MLIFLNQPWQWQRMAKLVLIDGHAILHRAYHALPPLTNKAGLQTNAVYGFMTMLLRILADLKPTHLAVAFDLPQPTFRQQQYLAYQAKRPEMGEELKDQVKLIHELLGALQIPYYEVAGFEADDVIGTLATQATELLVNSSEFVEEAKNYELKTNNSALDVVIVTGDRDMLQLVNDRVKVCVPVKGLSETKIYDEKLIKEGFGVTPSQWVDVKALKGDASDNYPGVRGIGPKTAQELIARFGSLENLYGKLGELDPRTAQKLAEGAEDAGLAQKLAKIVCDVPTKLDLEASQTHKIDWRAGAKYMKEKLGFKSLLSRLPGDISQMKLL